MPLFFLVDNGRPCLTRFLLYYVPYFLCKVKSIGSDDASCLIKEVEVEEEEQMKYRNRKISKRNKKAVNKVNLSRKGLSRRLKV